MRKFARIFIPVLFFIIITACSENANHTPVITLNNSSNSSNDVDLYAGESETFTAITGDEDGDTLTVSWNITSTTLDGYDCGSIYGISPASGNTVTVTLPLRFEDVRCADEVLVTATVSDGTETASASIKINVVPVPDRGLVWQEDPRNPIVDRQDCPHWECLGHTDPAVGRLADNTLAVWFSAGGDWESWPAIGRAVESGGDFVLDTDPVIYPRLKDDPDPDPKPWDYIRETVTLRFDNTSQRWKIWYLGYSVDYFTDPAIGQTSSLDAAGTQWQRSADPIYRPAAGAWDSDFLTSPSALMGPDGVWRLYYTGASFAQVEGKMRVGMLTSDDGETWSAYSGNPVFEGVAGQWDESILDPHVQFIGGRYVMWYSALIHPLEPTTTISIGVATSEDGITWTRHSGNPVLSPSSPVSWNDFRVLDPEVFVEEDGSLTMVGYGASSTETLPGFYPDRLGLWTSAGP